MTAEIPTIIPSSIDAGLNFSFKRKYDNYLPTDSWVSTMYIFNKGIQYTVTATDNGDSYHLFSKVASDTASYIAGDYSYNILVVNGINKWPIESGVITINPNIITATGGIENRSKIKIILDNLDKVIEALSVTTTTEVTINGKSYKRSSLNELLKTRDRYQTMYNQELANIALANGGADPKKIYARFTPRW